MFPNRFQSPAVREDATILTAQQRQILNDLSDRGPGLLVELAVRQLTLPEQISTPLAELRERGLVRAEAFAGGPLGSELYFLTDTGQQAIARLREEAARGGPSHSAPAKSVASAGHDLRVQEVELLRKLGDLADRTGETDQARQYYKEALNLTQALAEHREPYSG